MDEVIVIVLLATLFAICFGAVEIYIRLNDDKKTIWLWTEIVSVALMLFFWLVDCRLINIFRLELFQRNNLQLDFLTCLSLPGLL